ncbi:hypothetical protein ACFOQM_15160 [Paenibacillus sp. GCM10012307]|uniref:DUF5011 domain-containing protein n=1 Tax=Paenibacillus roseus TaxID=2798579 RepID=A0A934J923_9BACL|nr:hypothetical protein [Paenibacillus roseus]MBJ6362600.1 hypothetical protein [Paenibacillus roseus]
MLRKHKTHRLLGILLILSTLLLPLQGMFISVAQAAGEDREVFFGNGVRVGNQTYSATNAVVNFNSQKDGFTYSKSGDVTIDFGAGDTFSTNGSVAVFELDVSKNSYLKELAASGHAEVQVGWSALDWIEECTRSVFGICLDKDYQGTEAWIDIGGVNQIHERAYHGGVGPRSITRVLGTETKIRVTIEGIRDSTDERSGVRGLYFRFKDVTAPVMTGYTFTGDGAERTNPNTGEEELYVKANENITLAYEFSEPVRPTALNSGYYEHFLRHPLFVNPTGTGLPAAGQQQYLQNRTYTSAASLKELNSRIVYQYIGAKYHHSGNIPLDPKITGTSDGSPIDQTMEQKLKDAVLTDAAGNAVRPNFPGKASTASLDYLKSKTVNPFDYKNGGFKVIVDAVAPKYTKAGNGIQPEILTGMTLNNNDVIDFSLQLSEEAVVRKGYVATNTYLLLNNGIKAHYVSGENSDKWLFRAYVTDKLIDETPLLKVIALSNSQKGDDSDKGVLQDYAGNILMQPANYQGLHRDENGEDESLVNSTIDWAKLSIDNTKPVIGFRYEADGATDLIYRKNGKVTIDANDPPVKIPHLEPDASQRGTERPSRGIYRPSNMTGPASPSVGLVYYWWSQSPDNPFADKGADQFAAIKRYALSAKQPSEELYPGEYANVQLQVTNNKTNLIAPPSEAFTAEGSGEWYLHAWTADMTWDSARELMQYAKMKSYISDNPGQYEAWKAELANAPEAEQIFYANNKAMQAVGQYGDTAVWPLSNFKQEDSNWTYAVTTLKMDNKAPDVVFSQVTGDQSVNVQVEAVIDDKHSGVDQVFYQWVKDGSQPSDIEWRPAVISGTQARFATQNNVFEDGQYWLYIKASDHAGNEGITMLEAPVTVNSEQTVHAEFVTEANPNYAQSHAVRFYISGIVPEKVAYAYSISAARPSVGAYTDLTISPDDPDNYLIPADPDRNGIQYLHLMAKEGERYYYYSKAYYFDNEPPAISFSKSGVAYPLDSQEVQVTVTEPYSKQGLSVRYQWVRDGEAAPDESSPLWEVLPEGGVAAIDASRLQPGEIADFRLHVLAVDGAGNRALAGTTGTFKVSRAGGSDTEPAASQSDLIYVHGDEQDGYTAILKLSLDTVDKRGYEFSLSPDYGVSWGKWRPYTNFASLKVPAGTVADQQIMVKYRTPGGKMSEPQPLRAGTLSPVEPVYAIATLHTTRPVNPNRGVDIEVAAPLGIKIVTSAVNPAPLIRKGNTFTVKENGYYAFDLTDTANPDRKETLYAVVNSIDGDTPVGSIEYLITGPTNSNVTVKLGTSKPVQITNNQGRNVYIFNENGSFTFEFKDEAGNTGTATATVSNIDKQGPRVKLVRSYNYGPDGSRTFGTIRDHNGNVILSSGVTLEVQKEDALAKDFIVLNSKPAVSIERNGTLEFIVADLFGNTTVLKEEVSSIVAEAPAPDNIAYTFVDEQGNPVPPAKIATIDGRKYAKGSVKVTLTGKTAEPNRVFAGMAPIVEGGAYSNEITKADGSFSYARTFSAEGQTIIAISDLLGNVNRIPVTVQGLDNKAPELVLKQAQAGVVQNKKNFDFRTDLGGYTVTDNVSKPENIKVSISALDLSKTGRQQVTYTATDEVGNTSTIVQDVYVIGEDGMLIFGNGALISAGLGESVLFDTNAVTFNISRHNLMNIGGKREVNERGTYELMYQSGLYREGQMKYIAKKLTYEELVNGKFTVTFPQAGWYTIIVRNQEREREYATFFISRTK